MESVIPDDGFSPIDYVPLEKVAPSWGKKSFWLRFHGGQLGFKGYATLNRAAIHYLLGDSPSAWAIFEQGPDKRLAIRSVTRGIYPRAEIRISHYGRIYVGTYFKISSVRPSEHFTIKLVPDINNIKRLIFDRVELDD